MFIKLQVQSETEKAYQLPNGAWIPKKALKAKGMDYPYFEVEGWWLLLCMEKRYEKDTQEKFKGLHPLVVKILPKEIHKKLMDYLQGGNSYMYDSTDRRWEIPDYKSL